MQVDYRLHGLLSKQLKVDRMSRPTVKVEVDKLQYLPGADIGGFFEEVVTANKSYSQQPITHAVLMEVGADNTSTSGCIFPETVLSGYTSNQEIPQSRGFGGDHKGIDFAVPTGTVVNSPWDGVVHTVSMQSGYGQLIIIQHGGPHDIYTYYGHLHQVLVSKGDTIIKGQPIGQSGGDSSVDGDKAGSSSGPHLHFELRTVGTWYHGNPNNPVDPAPYLFNAVCGFPGVASADQNTNPGTTTEFSGHTTTVFSEKFVTNPLLTSSVLQSFGWKFSVQPVTEGQSGSGYMYAKLSDVGTASLNILKQLNNNGILTVTFSTQGFDHNDSFSIVANGVTVYGPNRGGTDGKSHMIQVAVPSGANLELRYTNGGGHTSIVAVGSITLEEVSGTTNTKVDMTHTDVDTFGETLARSFRRAADRHKFGRFTVAETMTLESIVDIQVSEQFEQSTQELTITISNKDGFYSPDYDPSMFPEKRLKPSPWSYMMDGVRVGVLSENTPIRVELGYGDNLIRSFTGKIGRVVPNSLSGTMTISAYGMFKVLMNRTILFDLVYPPIESDEAGKFAWLKSSVAQDLVTRAGLINYVVQESTYLGAQPFVDYFYVLDSNNNLKKVPASNYNLLTPYGYVVPYTAPMGITFKRGINYEDAMTQLLQDTSYRAYCDRYGTFRLERMVYTGVVSKILSENENMISVSKTHDFSKSRSHIQLMSSDGNIKDMYDDELLINLKGEVRSAGIQLDYPLPADRDDLFRSVAARFFLDMKRVARTLNVVCIGDPTIDMLDRVMVVDKGTTTKHEYIVKGIKQVINKDGFLTYLDLTWDASEGSQEVS